MVVVPGCFSFCLRHASANTPSIHAGVFRCSSCSTVPGRVFFSFFPLPVLSLFSESPLEGFKPCRHLHAICSSRALPARERAYFS